MDRKLASIQRIIKLHELKEFDNLVLAEVLGWKCLVNKNDFKEGDLCIYFEVDSILPEKEEFEFLRKYKFKVKTQKIRGIYSQGLCMPVNDFISYLYDKPRKLDDIKLFEGMDVTEELGVTKYEEVLTEGGGEKKGNFPEFLLPKTDQRRIQEYPELLELYKDEEWIITEKLDGTSVTFLIYNNEFIVCSRNMMLKKSECVYWKIAEKYNLEEKMRAYKFRNNLDIFALQGEIVGQKIQKNKYNLDKQDLFIFDSYYNKEYISFYARNNYYGLWDICEKLNLQIVPVINKNFNLKENTVDSLVNLSIGNSLLNKDKKREGLVIRTIVPKFDIKFGKLSFKVINPEFLIKYGE
jgi:RNA ligase (TIGR02306 family)